LSRASSTSSALKIPDNPKEDPDDPESGADEDIRMEYTSVLFYSTGIGPVTKITCKD
jgi:hypothetical protein